MFAVQRITRHTPGLLKLSEQQCRTLMGTRPRVKVSFTEKMVHAALLYIGIMGIPLYISFNVVNYKKREA